MPAVPAPIGFTPLQSAEWMLGNALWASEAVAGTTRTVNNVRKGQDWDVKLWPRFAGASEAEKIEARALGNMNAGAALRASGLSRTTVKQGAGLASWVGGGYGDGVPPIVAPSFLNPLNPFDVFSTNGGTEPNYGDLSGPGGAAFVDYGIELAEWMNCVLGKE